LNLDNAFVRLVEVWEGGGGTPEHFIWAIRFTYQSRNTPETVQAHTGPILSHGTRTEFALERNEIISAISGKYGRYVDSITIQTMNVVTGQTRVHGRFGGQGGHVGYEYRVPRPPSPAQGAPRADTSINGLWGGAGRLIDSIGVILQRR
jgi:Jacalin-like lectin domain